jgi:hypothetical protein
MSRYVKAGLCVPLLFVLACASTTTDTRAVDVDVHVEQLPDAGFAVEDRGAVSIAYQMTVKNRSSEAITLRRIEMRASGSSPYTLRDTPAEVNETIAPGAEATVPFTMWGYPREQRSGARKIVSVNGTAHFDSGSGSFRKDFAQSFREP